MNVDMATYKAEFLSHYYEAACARARLRDRPHRQMGAPRVFAPGLANLMTQLPGTRRLVEARLAGVAQGRSNPPSHRRRSR